MQSFHCTNCQNLVFFENTECLKCHSRLAYLCDVGRMGALEPKAEGQWIESHSANPSVTYRLCDNYERHNICNWAVPSGEADVLCESCRLTQVLPDISIQANKLAWYRLEVAKRRLLYTLDSLRLPTESRQVNANSGLGFQFLSDATTPNGDRQRVITGHDNGLITINIEEADDVLREAQRRRQNEPYRTLLGHFRHEIGHYFWDRLISATTRLESFRATFSDERADYASALERHYECGPPVEWEQTFVSAYASAHPWEDWAETWAHYLHMFDALETARTMGLSLRPKRTDEPSLSTASHTLRPEYENFDEMVAEWISLTYVLNNLNRGLGRADGYPFVLSPMVVMKLCFVHDTIVAVRTLPGPWHQDAGG